MVRNEAPVHGESHRQPLLPVPSATAPPLDSTESTRLTTKLATKLLVLNIAAFMSEFGAMLHFDATLTRTPLPDSFRPSFSP